MSDDHKAEETEIDEALYSRQLYVMGHEAQKRMAQSNVLIAGLNGLGVEIAKNIILAGVKSVTLLDDTATSFPDLGAQFYLSEESIGQPRAAACLAHLAELNPYVTVSLATGELTQDLITSVNCVVLVDRALDEQLRVNDICHAHNIRFLSADVRGVFGSLFCDFGDEFEVLDVDGEPAATSMIASIQAGSPTLITVLEDTRHGLMTGDVVRLTDIQGMTELNDREFEVTVKDNFSFEIDCDSTNFTAYGRDGNVVQVKQPQTLSFEPLRDAIQNANFMNVKGDEIRMHLFLPLHVAFQALHRFQALHNGDLPRVGNQEDADELVTLAQEANVKGGDSDSKEPELFVDNLGEDHGDMLRALARTARGVVNPMCALMGGVVGQEVMKACSGKFMPIKQFFYFSDTSVLPDEPLPEADVQPVGSRYDANIMVFGREIQERIENARTFLIGAGAIGCEMLKNWAMLGLATGENGHIHVTDMDVIEKSNLSRQFLFRSSDVNKPKSTTACAAANRMNQQMHITAMEEKLAPDTEDIFDDDFFGDLSFVTTALDNVEARLYVDQRCLFYHLPLLDSGTLGTKGSTQVVVPGLSEHYGATRDPPEKGIPICTLKHFPNKIEHTLAWAREWFEGAYNQTPSDVQKYMTQTSEEFANTLDMVQTMKLDTVQRIQKDIADFRVHSFDDCLAWARVTFEDLFSNSIKQLLHTFPVDKVTTTGQLFWSGPKKPPSPLAFDLEDDDHRQFVIASAIQRASVYGIPVPDNVDSVYASVVPSVTVPVFVPRDDVKIATTEDEAKSEGKAPSADSSALMNMDEQVAAILSSLPEKEELCTAYPSFSTVDFDKDIDEHMLVVMAASNLRARNYGIQEADLHTSRGIAGKIIPAIATTTALVTGLVCLELIKTLQEKPLEAFRCTTLNIGFPTYTSFEPQEAAKKTSMVKGNEWRWNQWDRIEIEDSNITMQGLCDYLKDEYNLDVSMLSCGSSLLLSDFMPKKKRANRLTYPLREVFEKVSKTEVQSKQRFLIFEAIVVDATSHDEVEIPYIRLHL
jgi:ubiquitin-activating enzyme E1